MRHNRHTVTGEIIRQRRHHVGAVTQTVTVVTKANVQPSQLTHSTKKESDGVTVVTQKSLPLLTTAQQLTASHSASTSPGSRDTRKHLRLRLRPSDALGLDATVVRLMALAKDQSQALRSSGGGRKRFPGKRAI